MIWPISAHASTIHSRRKRKNCETSIPIWNESSTSTISEAETTTTTNQRMSKGSIKDPSIRLKPSEQLIEFMVSLSNEAVLPENIWKFIEISGGKAGKVASGEVPKPSFSTDELTVLKDLPSVESVEFSLTDLSIDFDDSEDDSDDELDESIEKPTSKGQAIKQKRLQRQKERARLTIDLNDIKWLDRKLSEKRSLDADFDVYLHELLTGSRLVLPKNEILERNPVLEARCVRLRLEQEARMYNAMTKNVDSARTRLPEDTISYQSKSNPAGYIFHPISLIIATLQFFSQSNKSTVN